MANARKCDLCEKCFDPMNENGYMARFRNPVFQTSNDIREGVRGFFLLEDEGPDAVIDLCPRCSAGFLSFMNYAKSKNEAIDKSQEEENAGFKSAAEDLNRRIGRYLRFAGLIKDDGDTDGD